MQRKRFKVVFQPFGRTVYVLPDTLLLEAAARAGFVLQTPCGGAGTCGKCRIKLISGACSSPADAHEWLSLAQRRDGWRLACRCRITEDLVVEVPEDSLFESGTQILACTSTEEMEVAPVIRRQVVQLDPPTRGDARSDLARLSDALGGLDLDLPMLAELPQTLRGKNFQVTVVTAGAHVVSIQPGRIQDPLVGVTVDLGTTTLVCTLVDLDGGHDLAIASRVNPQTSFGDDVLARIQFCREHPDGLERMQRAVMDAVNDLMQSVCRQAGISLALVVEIVVAGNTAMQQIFCGLNPVALGELPFVPVFNEILDVKASELGLGGNPFARVCVLPQIGGFVGGDTVAGIVATRLDRQDKPALLVDVGTNGEIVLACDGKLLATSVAAGPAFEGARIRHGMRAATGAIEKVVMDQDVLINTIGNAPAAGLCGTGLIDAVAGMLCHGLLDETGRLLSADECAGASQALLQRLISQDGEAAFLLAGAEETATGEPVCLYQQDIRELQLANGAIRAGIGLLLEEAGLAPEDLDRVLLAGAFGNFIRRKHAVRIGMLPALPSERIQFVGNTASFGARRLLLSSAERDYAESIRARTIHMDLSLNPRFQSAFGEAMLFRT